MQQSNINWDATAFFASLTEKNKFAKAHDFVFARVSGLDGFEEVLQQLQSATAIVAVSDISQGYIEVNTAHAPREDGLPRHATRPPRYGSTPDVHERHARAVPPVHEQAHPRKDEAGAAQHLPRPSHLLSGNRPILLLRLRLCLLSNRSRHLYRFTL